jgi:hypothetical protein
MIVRVVQYVGKRPRVIKKMYNVCSYNWDCTQLLFRFPPFHTVRCYGFNFWMNTFSFQNYYSFWLFLDTHILICINIYIYIFCLVHKINASKKSIKKSKMNSVLGWKKWFLLGISINVVHVYLRSKNLWIWKIWHDQKIRRELLQRYPRCIFFGTGKK